MAGQGTKLYVSIPELKKLNPRQRRNVFWARVQEAQERAGEKLLSFARRQGVIHPHPL
jgi:hypothetical protein